MKHSISEAARIVGVTRKTFYKHIDKKSISVEKDDNDNPVIDASELIRVYGDQCNFEYDKDTQSRGASTQIDTALPMQSTESLAIVQKELELLQKQRSDEKDALEEQIDYLRQKLDESTSEQRKLTALLTDQREKEDKGQAWEKSLKALEARIANQEKAARAQNEERQKILQQNRALKAALSKEKNKTVWQRLFG